VLVPLHSHLNYAFDQSKTHFYSGVTKNSFWTGGPSIRFFGLFEKTARGAERGIQGSKKRPVLQTRNEITILLLSNEKRVLTILFEMATQDSVETLQLLIADKDNTIAVLKARTKLHLILQFNEEEIETQ
jgi:hypothetical protein